MRTLINKAKNLVSLGLIEKDGESWEVDGAIVLKKKEKNYSDLSCSCESCTWTNNLGLCHRKIAVILFEAQSDKFKIFINEKIKCYEKFLNINMKPDLQAFIEDLKLLRGLK